MPTATTAPVLHLALIGDLISSRQLSERADVQRALMAFLEQCNRSFAPFLHSPFRITLGDEFQGLAGTGFPLEEFVLRLNAALRPRARARLGMGLGTLATHPGPVVGDLDGPCFHSARDAVNEARQRQALLAVRSATGDTDTRWLQQQLALIEAHLRRLSLVRWETAALLLELRHPAAVARARGVTRQSIDDALAGGLIPEVLDGLRAFSSSLDCILSGGSALKPEIQADQPADQTPRWGDPA